MLSSLQVGLRALNSKTEAVLVGLGDQPHVQEKTIRKLVDSYMQSAAGLIVPSYQMHRGHPWLVARNYWAEILDLAAPRTPRDFLAQHSAQIHYVEVDTPSVLADLDTMEDYTKYNPQHLN
jgi:molybdenum cofactor cytidylyltransferase